MSKRGAHEGSIFQRKDGRWAASLHLGYRDGKRQRKTFYGKTRREVQEALTRALRDLQDGIAIRTDERETTAEYLHRWLDASARQRVRPRTLAGYRLIVNKHLIPAVGRVPVARLSPDEVQRLLNRKSSEGAKPQTVRNIHAACAVHWHKESGGARSQGTLPPSWICLGWTAMRFDRSPPAMPGRSSRPRAGTVWSRL